MTERRLRFLFESGRVLDREGRERGEPIAAGGVRQRAECGLSLRGLLARKAGRVLESARGFDGGDHRLELRDTAALYGVADDRTLLVVAVLQRVNQWQRRLALREIIAEVLAALLGVRPVIEHVIHQLVR